MNKLVTESEFKKAQKGQSFIDVCRYCFLETGDIVFNNRTREILNPPINLPKHITSPHSICEFCEFLKSYVNGQIVDNKNKNLLKETSTSWGCCKLIEMDNGVEKTIAFVPFSSNEIRSISVARKSINLRHGMKILCTQEDGTIKPLEVVQQGHNLYMDFGD